MNPTLKNEKHRLLLDVTIAATTELNTGIQRVVRKVCRYADSVSRDEDIRRKKPTGRYRRAPHGTMARLLEKMSAS